MTGEATNEEGCPMANADEMEGRVKRAVGEITGDDDLKREGAVDKGTGKAKEAVYEAGDKMKDVLKKDE